MTMMDAVKNIRGPKGTKVKLTIMRKGKEKPIEFSITRDVIPLRSVRHYLLSPEIGYVRISNFRSKTTDDLESSLDELEKNGKLKGLILDLRNNPGGLLNQAVDVSDVFLDSGVIVSTKGRNSSQNVEAMAHKNEKPRDYPIIVLVNSGSASAAEIVAGALQDNKKALILGTRTFGKGSVQTILPLSDGSGLRLTTARYYTPSGKSIQLSGITPDIELAFVPSNKDKEKATHRFMREEDLKRHMAKEEKEGKEQKEDETENQQDKRVRILLEKDNQVRHAMQLLKTWGIFSQIKTGSCMIEKKRLFFLVLLPVSLACLIFLGAYFFSSSNKIRISPPVYEEIYSSRSDLREKIRNIDYAIYESLYRSGIRERDISFQNVETRHQNGNVWNFTEIYVKCPDSQCMRNLQVTITHDLIALGPGISYRYEKTPDNGIVCHVSAQDFYTHKIVLGFDSRRIPVKAVRSRVAIIIDDLGYDPDIAFSFIHLGMPISLSVLPRAPYTDMIVREANENGCEIILHLPMEPKHYPSVDPGPGALFLSMSEQEILQVLGRDLRDIPGARGVNNHMGSSFTEDRDKMLVVLKELKRKNLFYVDSRTTSNTVGFKLAKNLGLPAAKRSVFLDNDLAPKAIRMQMGRLLSMARHSGFAIGIGHPHKETLAILKEYDSVIKDELHVVPVLELVR